MLCFLPKASLIFLQFPGLLSSSGKEQKKEQQIPCSASFLVCFLLSALGFFPDEAGSRMKTTRSPTLGPFPDLLSAPCFDLLHFLPWAPSLIHFLS